MNIVTKEEAIKLNQNWYFTGISCTNGHISKRYVKRNTCFDCKNKWNRNNYKNQKPSFEIRKQKHINKIGLEKFKEKAKNYRDSNKDRLYIQTRKWAIKNREIVNNYKNKWIKVKKEKDPLFKLNCNIKNAIYKNLKLKKGGKKWQTFVNFTLEELKSHLEAKFDCNMSWENYGNYWHVDHIKPLAKFNLEKEFDKAWDLNNLQPLERIENLKKKDKYE